MRHTFLFIFTLSLFVHLTRCAHHTPSPPKDPEVSRKEALLTKAKRIRTTKHEQCPSPPVSLEKIARIQKEIARPENWNKFIEWEAEPGGLGNLSKTRVVYEYKGIRYTMWLDPYFFLPNEVVIGWIKIQEEDPQNLHLGWQAVYYDRALSGCVNQAYDSGNQILPRLPELRLDWRNMGAEHHSAWQERYSQALTGLAIILGVE